MSSTFDSKTKLLFANSNSGIDMLSDKTLADSHSLMFSVECLSSLNSISSKSSMLKVLFSEHVFFSDRKASLTDL